MGVALHRVPGTAGSGRDLSTGSRLVLVAAGDDLFLEEALKEACGRIADAMGGAEIETVPAEATPEDVAVELNSPSLFSPERILLVPDIGRWVIAPAAPGGPATGSRKDAKKIEALVKSLVATLAEGVPEGTGLVMGVWCGAKPAGPLVDAVEAAGALEWIPLPDPPKPWERGTVSEAQKSALRRLIGRAAPDARLAPAAEALLFDRLGFAPRRLVQETMKLAMAAGEGTPIDEVLVRRLVLPREGSLEVLQDALLDRDAPAAAAFLDQARRGLPVRDWSGEYVDDRSLGIRVFNMAVDAWTRMLYLRGTAAEIGAVDQLDPTKNGERGWYSRTFKTRLGPKLKAHIEGDPGAPFSGGRGTAKPRAPSPWALHRLFRAAGLYADDELARCLIEAGPVERGLRRSGDPLDAVPAWLLGTLRPR